MTDLKVSGEPVGTPDGQVICDSCNKLITSVRQLCDDEHDPTAHIYVTGDSHGWYLRWTNCEECGPIGSGEANEPGEAHIRTTFQVTPIGIIVVDSATIVDYATPQGEDR